MSEIVSEVAGYVASTLVFSALYMRTMIPLRILAIASNIAFLTYAGPLRLWPIIILHGLLLPLNILRLMQIQRMLRTIKTAQSGAPRLEGLFSSGSARTFKAGDHIFRKGDGADCAFYVRSGMIHLPEIGSQLEPGAILGEMGLFSVDRNRTASALCVSDVEVYRLDQEALVVALYQNSAFAIALLRLVMSRMMQNLARLELQLAGRNDSASNR